MSDVASSPPPVSVLGLGSLGSALARALLTAGQPTTVWNRTAGRADDLVTIGASQAPTAAAAIAATEIVVIAVADEAAVRGVLGSAAGELAGRVLVNLTSGTPEQARSLAEWATAQGAAYLDGAAMSGVRLVGRADALFLYSGSAEAFTAVEGTVSAFGSAAHLGADAGIASLYDTALLGVNMSLLTGFYHALALVGSAGVDAREFAVVATGYLPFALGLLADHARQTVQGQYPPDEGTLDVLASAVDHLVTTSARAGVRTDVPDGIRALVQRGIDEGHGEHGPASLVEVLG
ncbi:NAD(P)-dependent oxidoreductase [Pseudonocardia cypriaca]|uniref:3-hydroxyisobutyrate dehydrogenase-like beta-hydroxyacid dehydrogenase n=1 Tax=Pseudonocardia cypriaca TaxID=882449 RepID=A0A543GB63_9PSEU|nr:NAD(P)-binding domain-containing protein [Pseudonocardia cypriaca]TQM43308.1 3-hydroxyisobutyrate dehydrogenase-like beta-hydroxyacid dehydrogenase [Pseudonocardia cypriaca]